jgi:hypothetical protein
MSNIRAVVAAGVALLLTSVSVAAPGDQSFSIRNHNPFLNIFGLPQFQDASLAADGEINYGVLFDVANHGESNDTEDEFLIIDGESYTAVLSLRYGVARWLEIGFDLPYVSRTGGSLDNAIESWHDLIGASNSRRIGPDDQLHFFYDGPRSGPFELVSSDSGIGDVQLTAAVPLVGASGSDRRAVSLRTSVKLPTGDSGSLLGSGATDLSLGIYATNGFILANQNFSLSGIAGVVFLGAGDVLPEIQERTVPFGGLATTWQATERFAVTAQVYAQGSYFNSDIDELGGSSVQVVLGATYRFAKSRFSLSAALVEDSRSDATTDFALHIAVRAHGR